MTQLPSPENNEVQVIYVTGKDINWKEKHDCVAFNLAWNGTSLANPTHLFLLFILLLIMPYLYFANIFSRTSCGLSFHFLNSILKE